MRKMSGGKTIDREIHLLGEREEVLVALQKAMNRIFAWYDNDSNADSRPMVRRIVRLGHKLEQIQSEYEALRWRAT